jgi:hypothetical protein
MKKRLFNEEDGRKYTKSSLIYNYTIILIPKKSFLGNTRTVWVMGRDLALSRIRAQ